MVPADKGSCYYGEQESDSGDFIDLVAGEFLVGSKRFLVVCDYVASNKSSDIDIADILTKRELQVALLVSKGRVNKQIADQLSLSEWTVATHLRRIYAKLGVRTRAAMVARIVKYT